MRHVRQSAINLHATPTAKRHPTPASRTVALRMRSTAPSGQRRNSQRAGPDLRRRAWQWAQRKSAANGSLPSGREIAGRFERHERWGRLVKRTGLAGLIDIDDELRPTWFADEAVSG